MEPVFFLSLLLGVSIKDDGESGRTQVHPLAAALGTARYSFSFYCLGLLGLGYRVVRVDTIVGPDARSCCRAPRRGWVNTHATWGWRVLAGSFYLYLNRHFKEGRVENTHAQPVEKRGFAGSTVGLPVSVHPLSLRWQLCWKYCVR